MIMSQIDDKPNLFSVKDVYSDELIRAIQQVDFMNYQYLRVDLQEFYPRRNIQYSNSDILAQLNKEIVKNLEQISNAIDIPLQDSGTKIWIDNEGFNMNVHVDNTVVDIALQTYLLPAQINLGTKFYHDAEGQNLRYDFPYIVNTGYIMINSPDQWHGIPNTVPAEAFRCSSYTYFTRKT